MKTKKIRLSIDQEAVMEVCPHIKINGFESKGIGFKCYEYLLDLCIYCEKCDKTYKFEVMVN